MAIRSRFLLPAFMLVLNFTQAQTDSVYTSAYLGKSTRFAWTTYGADLLVLGGGKSPLPGGSEAQVNFGPGFIPRLTIGGVHFWGHGEFYVHFPLPFLSFQQRPDPFSELTYKHGIETGFRVFPLKLKPGRISPYIGTSFKLLSYRQEPEGSNYRYGGAEYQKMIFPLHAGLSYTTKKHIINLGIQYQSLRNISYYTAPGELGTVNVEPLSIQLGLTRYIDTDKSMRNKEGVEQENLKHAILVKEKKLGSWYWALGPSAAIQTSKSPYLQSAFPQLYDNYVGGFIPDIAFGRYLYKPDMNIGLSYRTYGSTLEGFSDQVKMRRHSLMLESYKFLFNWLGFVPFAGVTASVESLRTEVNGTRYTETKPALGFIFGWDIRVTQTGTSLLRTNLRWTPGLHQSINNEKLMYDNLEFNFIQWVQFIGRKKVYRKYAKQ